MTRTLREAIDASGLPLTELQRRTGVDRSQLSRFMRGERSLTLQSVDSLADELGLRLVYRVRRE
ncbi:MAG: helix-turn-helix transcriptional regulator [Thermoanaerobaculia bacterium]|nr:helix-turn-helix transcriptional regulator [Thermoanaerobaculia bacterium]